jgi:hypothetical protein
MGPRQISSDNLILLLLASVEGLCAHERRAMIAHGPWGAHVGAIAGPWGPSLGPPWAHVGPKLEPIMGP